MEAKVRPAVETDCGVIIEMIRQLAIVEKMVDQVKMTPAMLEKDGFGSETPFFHAFVAEDARSKEVIGFTIFFHHYSLRHGKSIHLEDLFVKTSHRNLGIGSQLMRAVAEFGASNNCSGLHLHCIEWNSGPMQMYKRRGAVDLSATEGRHIIRFNGPQFEQLFLLT